MSWVLARRRCAVVAIAAIVDDAVVIEVCRQPRNSGMTIFTDITAIDVRRMFAGCVSAVVTAGAITHNPDVIERSRQPANRRVAIITIVAAIYVIQIFTIGDDTVMAGPAGANDLCVVDNNFRHKGDNAVTILTNVRCLDMRIVLAGRVRTVVATRTIANDIDVIEIRRDPGDRGMAIVASNAAGDVVDVFAACCNSVMARTAGTNHLCMIDQVRGSPEIDAVAVLANDRCLNMHRVLASRVDAVMAAGAIARDIDVIEVGGQPGHGRMTVVAIVATGEMVEVLTGCCDAVMTRSAAAKHLRVVNHVGRQPGN